MGPHSVVKPNSVLGIHLVFGSNLSQGQCVVVGPISKGPYFVVEIIVLCGPQGRIFFNKGVLMILFRPFLMHICLMGPPTHFLICYQPLIINFNIYIRVSQKKAFVLKKFTPMFFPFSMVIVIHQYQNFALKVRRTTLCKNLIFTKQL